MGVVLIATLAFGLITPPYGLVLLMASKFVGVQFSQGAARGAADLRGVPGDHRLHDLFSEGRAVAAEAGDPGIGRLLQVAVGDGIYLSELVIRARGRANPTSSIRRTSPGSLKPERRAVAVVDPSAAQRFRYRLHHGVVADEQDHALADDGRAIGRCSASDPCTRSTATARRPAAGWIDELSIVAEAVLPSSPRAIERPSRLPKSQFDDAVVDGEWLAEDAAAMISAVFTRADERAGDDMVERSLSAADLRQHAPARCRSSFSGLSVRP